jgi:tetraacyldisaccharide 4'-kinase
MRNNRLMEIMASSRTYPVNSAATLLWGVSKLYGGMMRLRRKLYDKQMLPSYQLPCPVVSVGNLALGGAGKTPMAIHLARFIKGMGYRVVIISRGYKGTAQNKGAIVSDGRVMRCDVAQSGDEPNLMAQLLENIPVVVGKDRYSAGQKAVEQFDPDILLLDDAFQHLRLKRDLNLLLLDASRPFGNSHVFPRGRLREPIDAITDADAVVMTRSERGNKIEDIKRHINRREPVQVFCSRHRSVLRGKAPANRPLPSIGELYPLERDLSGMRLFAYAGLADNQSFFEMVEMAGGRLMGRLSFEDHFRYGDAQIERLDASAAAAGADVLITTDKDYVRLSGKARFSRDVIVMGVELDFMEDAPRWQAFIAGRVNPLIGCRKVF